MHGVRSANYILQEADLLIVLRARLMTRRLAKPNVLSNANYSYPDIDRAELGKIAAAIQADVDDVLAQLIPLVEHNRVQSKHQLVADFGMNSRQSKACDPN